MSIYNNYQSQAYDEDWYVCNACIKLANKVNTVTLVGKVPDSFFLCLCYNFGPSAVYLNGELDNKYSIKKYNRSIVNKKLVTTDLTISFDKECKASNCIYCLLDKDLLKGYSTATIDTGSKVYYIYYKGKQVLPVIVKYDVEPINPVWRLATSLPDEVKCIDGVSNSLDDILSTAIKDYTSGKIAMNLRFVMGNSFSYRSMINYLIKGLSNVSIDVSANCGESIQGRFHTYLRNNNLESYEVIATNRTYNPDIREYIMVPSNIILNGNIQRYQLKVALSTIFNGVLIRIHSRYASGIEDQLIFQVEAATSILPSDVYSAVVKFVSIANSIDLIAMQANSIYIFSISRLYRMAVKEIKPFPRAVNIYDMKRLVCDEYMYTMKSTGDRVNVYITTDGIFVRNMNGYTKCISTKKFSNITILDAEDINGKIYLFDVVVFKDCIVTQLPFVKRIKLLDMISEDNLIHKKFYDLVNINKMKNLCLTNEGIVLYNKYSVYSVCPIKIKNNNTIDTLIDKNKVLYSIAGQSSSCSLSIVDKVDIPKAVLNLLEKANIIPGLIYEISYGVNKNVCCGSGLTGKIIRRKICSYKGKDIHDYYLVNKVGFEYPLLVLRRDKYRPNASDTIDEISKNCGNLFLNSCDLNYMRSASRCTRSVLLLLSRMFGCRTIFDVGAGRGVDVRRYKEFEHICFIEPNHNSYTEAVKRYNESKLSYSSCECTLAKVDISTIDSDMLKATFCANLFGDKDLDTMKQILSLGCIKCVMLIYVDILPKAYDGKHIKIKLNKGGYEVSRIRTKRAMSVTKERVVKLRKMMKGYTSIVDSHPYGNVAMTEDEHHMMDYYRVSLYFRDNLIPSIDRNEFMLVDGSYNVTMKDFINARMDSINGKVRVSLGLNSFIVQRFEDPQIVGMFRYLKC